MLFINSRKLEPTIFPDKTSQVWKLPEELLTSCWSRPSWHPVADINWHFEDEREIIQLGQLKDILEANNIQAWLHIHYLPYGRQDKNISNNATFALHTFARILNLMRFSKVVIDDPHSDVAIKLIRNSAASYPTDVVNSIYVKEQIDLVCYPDKGALAKYKEIYPYPFVYGEKDRDLLTGRIVGYNLVGEVNDKNILIVDDLCDGGMTFRILAKDLLAAGAKKVILFVSHGIFSNGLSVLFESGINKVYTPNDMRETTYTAKKAVKEFSDASE